MKKVVTILCLISIAIAQDEEATTASEAALVTDLETSETTAASANSNCDPWPSHLKPVKECCNIPNYADSLVQSICISKCNNKMQREARIECELVCYVNQTALIQDEKINKPVVRRIYENNGFIDRQWKSNINAGVEKCEYVATGSLQSDLMNYYNCVNDYLGDNCVRFLQTNECDATEQHYMKCKNIEPNCSSWPSDQMQPEACCKIFPLISENLEIKCRHECQRKQFFLNRLQDCIYNCTYTETGLISDEKIDFEIVKKMLIESSHRSLEWEKPIELTVENCEMFVRGLEARKVTTKSITRHLQSCIYEILSDNCGEYRSEPSCNKLKRFRAKCPDTKPRRTFGLRFSIVH